MALLEYLMTPIRLQGTHSSPLQLMKKRTIRGILPVRQQGTCSNDYERKLSRRQEQAKHQSGSQYKPEEIDRREKEGLMTAQAAHDAR